MTGTPHNPGIIPLALKQVFNHIASAERKTQFLVNCSYVEIYKEDLRDLIGKCKLNCSE